MPLNLRRRILIRLARLSILGILCSAFAAAFAISQQSFTWADFSNVLAMRVKIGNFIFFLAFLILANAIFAGPAGFYHSHRLSSSRKRFLETILAVSLLTGSLLLLRGPLHLQFANGQFLAVFWSLSVFLLFLCRELIYRALRLLRVWGRNLRRIVIVGEPNRVQKVTKHLHNELRLGYRIEHTISASTQNKNSIIEDLKTALVQSPIDEVLVVLPPDQYASETRQIVDLCERQGILLRLETQPYDLKIARLNLDELEGIPVLTIQSGPQEDWHLLTKRLIDLIGGVALLILLSPLLLLVALLIKLDSRGPVFFRQERVGLNRRRFQLFKFRTMVEGADKEQIDLEEQNEAVGPVFKIRSDPRVTRIGMSLRRFSVDELPQLLNVIQGEMSLVGPRPLPVRDVERIDSLWQRRRFSVKPGITCLWQVNGRSDVSFDRWVRMDLEYIDHWSLELDFKILLKTIPAVLKGSGAY